MNILKPKLENIPDDLKALDQWVVWRLGEKSSGKPTKIPYSAVTGMMAKTNTPTTWTDFDTAWEYYQKHKFSGVGFVLTKDDPFAGIDLDRCMTSTGIETEIQEIVDSIPSYWEKSPSGTGLRCFLRGKLPKGGQAQ